jgi:lipoyl-dependent peroxiredoxin
MATVRTANAHWEGSLTDGKGRVSLDSSGLGTYDVTWSSRSADPNGRTSPEELIAAAHASCFSMALSHGLAQSGNPPERLAASATVTFVPGTGITSSVLEIEGVVPGIAEDAFRQAADTAKDNCPVSQALKGNVELSVTARLAQG